MKSIGRNRALARELQETLLDHDVCAVVTFFSRLEPDENVAVELVLVSGQQVSGANSGCHVKVMPTGMHKAIGGCKVQTGLFLHAQSVHVSTQQHGRSWVSTPD